MKSDQELFNEFHAKFRTVRLFTEAQMLQLMGRARQEVINDTKSRLPSMDLLKKEFEEALAKVKDDPSLVASYNRLTQDKAAWVWFTQGVAIVLKRFKDANTSRK